MHAASLLAHGKRKILLSQSAPEVLSPLRGTPTLEHQLTSRLNRSSPCGFDCLTCEVFPDLTFWSNLVEDCSGIKVEICCEMIVHLNGNALQFLASPLIPKIVVQNCPKPRARIAAHPKMMEEPPRP